VTTPPTPGNFHAVFGISLNLPTDPGGAMQIDVVGDSIIAETPPSDTKFGNIPTHAAILPNNARLFVASAGSVAGGIDVVTSFSPAFQSTITPAFGPMTAIGLPAQTATIAAISEDSNNIVTVTLATPLTNVTVGTIVISGVVIPPCSPLPCISLPQNAYDGGFAILSIDGTGTTLTYKNPTPNLPTLSSGGTATFPPQPVFLNSTQNNAMYVANYNSNSVSAINATSNFVSNTKTAGVHPVALAETPNGSKIYVANQGDNTVSSLNVADLSQNNLTGFTGITPVWVVARGDSQKVYVLTQGDGKLVTIDTATDTAITPDCSVTPGLCVGAGANFIFFDPHLNRLYVTNPATAMVYVFSDTGGANDTPLLLEQISFAADSTPCPAGCSPTAVTALADGSRFYVASYQTATSNCPDGIVGSCVIPSLAVFDANSLAFKTTVTLLTGPMFTGQTAVPALTACGPVPANPLALYTPGATRFRVFAVAATDSSHVYVSMCDAGAIADVNATNNNANGSGDNGTPPDTLITDLPTAFSNGATQPNGQPPNQNPVFMLTGQ
jgi:YVTN family beta-propeller protein